MGLGVRWVGVGGGGGGWHVQCAFVELAALAGVWDSCDAFFVETGPFLSPQLEIRFPLDCFLPAN